MKRRVYRKVLLLAAVLLADSLFFSLIDPRKAYSLVLIAGFGLLVATLYVALDALLVLVERIIPLEAMTRHRLLVSGTMLGGLLVAMQSIGQLTFKDLIVMLPLVAVAAFYLSYQKRQVR